MPIDFNALDSLVLSVCMDTFALGQDGNSSVVFNPIASQPGAPPYAGRGIWTVKPVTTFLEGQAPMSTSLYTLGLRLFDFTIPPIGGDQVTINGDVYTLDAFERDSADGISWTCKAAQPNADVTP